MIRFELWLKDDEIAAKSSKQLWNEVVMAAEFLPHQLVYSVLVSAAPTERKPFLRLA